MNQTSPSPIAFVDLVAQYRRHKAELDEAIRSVVETSAFIGGPHVSGFERDFAAYCGVKHAIGVANGTDAIALALRALGIGPGDEVITAANSFIASSEAVTMAGAQPVFVDVDEKHSLMDPEKVERAITPRTKAILPVHLYGQLADMEALGEIAKKRSLVLLEDSAQAHGATWKGRRAGSFGKAGCFSFYPGKNLGAYGDAGAVVTDDGELATKIRKLANHGRAEKFGHEIEGVNSRLDGLQAAILAVKLRHLETWTRERQEAARHYGELLAGIPGIVLPASRAEGAHVFHLYVIRVQKPAGSRVADPRGALRTFLEARGISTGIHYPCPLPHLKAYEHLGLKQGSFPVSERLAPEIVSLPIFPEITREMQQRVAGGVREYVEGLK